MKILMQGRVDLLESGGGDKIQIENTAKELRKLGIEVDIKPGFNVDYSAYDIVHLFQLDWTPETYLYAKKAKTYNKPIVLSPIHHNVDELKKLDDEYTFDFRRIAKILFRDQFRRDIFKNIYKSFFDKRKVYPTLASMFFGLKTMQKMALQMADVVLVQTQMEACDLIKTFGVDIKWQKVQNGVGEPFINVLKNLQQNAQQLGHTPFAPDFGDYILCVGRIEARKNQLNVIKAVDLFRKKHQKDVKLVFIGRKSRLKHFEYTYLFERQLKLKPWVVYLNEVPYEKMPVYYQNAKVCVSASWYETTGLTSLEALFCGTSAVASGSRAKEYLKDYVSYCEPDDVFSIESAIAAQFFNNDTLTLKLANDPDFLNYTWENSAKQTLKVYNLLLNS